MVNSSPASTRLDAVFHALSDPTRRAILRQVATRAKTVGEIADPFSMSLAAVSKHLKVLERAELIAREKQGSFQVISINARPMAHAHRWLGHYEAFWSERLDSLARSLEQKGKSR
jgi:DNA-binding transcriptional ArsR family regulator